MTVLDIISGAMRKLGVIASGENPAASEAQDGLKALNSLMGTWALEKLMCYGMQLLSFPLVAGKLSYTMGEGGDWEADWPTRIDIVNLIYTTGAVTPMTLNVEIINLEQYQAFIVPGTESTIPMWVYIDDLFPLKTFYFYTVPSVVNDVQLSAWSQITSFAELSTEIVLPPGYERALTYCLAEEMAPEFGVTIPVAVAASALDAKSKIKSYNIRTPLLQVDNALMSRRTGGFNYLTGE